MSQEYDTALHGGQQVQSLALGVTPTPHAKVPVLTILLYTTLMALSSGFGAVPFFVFGRLKPYWAGIANAVAVGVMLAASFELLQEGAPHSPALTILGMVIGALFIKNSQDYLSQFEEATFEDLQGADARKAMLIITVMAAHAFGEGSGVGVSFSGQRGWAQGLLVTIAIGLHNVPEGMAVAGVMMSKGSTPAKALYWTLLCSIPQALVSVPSYLFVETFSSLLPVALGFAAGCMVWIAFAELIPDALESADHGHVATAATFSAAWLQGLSMLIATLEQPSGDLSSPIQADAGTLTRSLIALLPCLLAPCGAALLASRLIPSVPVQLGAAAGSLGWLGAGALLRLVLSNRASLVAVLLCAVGGACLATMLLVATRKSEAGDSSKEGDSERGQGHRAAQCQSGEHEWPGKPQHTDAHTFAHPWLHQQGDGMAHIEGMPVKLHLNGDARATEPHVRTRTESPSYAQGVTWPAPLKSQVSIGSNGCAKEAFIIEQGQGPLQYADEGGTLPQYQGDKGHHPHPGLVRGSALFASAVLVTQGLPLGLSLGRLVATDPDTAFTHALLPCILAAVPTGVACAGVGRALAGGRSSRAPLLVAAVLSCVAGSTAVCFLVSLPLGKDNATLPMAALEYEHWVPLVEAAVAGAMLLAGIGHAWPRAAPQRIQQARLGLGLAFGLGLSTFLLQAVLCRTTPYCLQ